MTHHAIRTMVIACAVGLASTLTASAQEPLAAAKLAYAAAEYEAALRLLEPLETSEARQYAALCFLALGQTEAARQAIERMVTVAPLFTPSADDVPPRFAALVTEARRKMLPVVARQAFAEGRERFNAKQHADAIPHFELALLLADDPVWRQSADADDLRTLASGFVDLSKASTPAVQPVATTAAAPATDAPRLEAAPAPRTRTTAPVAIKQVVPPIPTNLARASAASGVFRLLIDATGKVETVTVVQSVHPRFDQMLIEAARDWLYAPGTLDGKPVASETTVNLKVQ